MSQITQPCNTSGVDKVLKSNIKKTHSITRYNPNTIKPMVCNLRCLILFCFCDLDKGILPKTNTTYIM